MLMHYIIRIWLLELRRFTILRIFYSVSTTFDQIMFSNDKNDIIFHEICTLCTLWLSLMSFICSVHQYYFGLHILHLENYTILWLPEELLSNDYTTITKRGSVKPWGNFIIAMTSHEHDVVSNHQSFDSLFRSLYGPTSKKHWSFVSGIHRWPMNSPHKGPVARKSFHLMTSSCGIYIYGCRLKRFYLICVLGRILSWSVGFLEIHVMQSLKYLPTWSL